MTGVIGSRGNDGRDGLENGLEIFARKLKAQREAAGLTQEQIARLMGYSTSVIAKLETCRTVPSEQHAAKADQALRTGTFVQLRQAMISGVYKPWVSAFLNMEQRATVLRDWQPLLVPGLLQTEAYAGGILRSGRPTDSDVVIEQLVTARMARQEILRRTDPGPPILSVIVGEAALRQRVGDAAVMRGQLRHLIEAGANPRITIQVMPFAAPAHPGLLGPFLVASFEHDPDVAYLDNALEGQITNLRSEVARVSLLYEALSREALSPAESVNMITGAMEEWT